MTIRRILALTLLFGLLLGTLAACGGQSPNPNNNTPSSELSQTTARNETMAQTTSRDAADSQSSNQTVIETMPQSSNGVLENPPSSNIGTRDSAIDQNGLVVAAVIPQDAILLPFHAGITNVAIIGPRQYEIDWEDNDTIQVRLREPAAGEYKDIDRYHISELPVELTYNLWLSSEGLWTMPGTTEALFYVKFFQSGDERFTVVPVAQPIDIIGPIAVTVDYVAPGNISITSFSGGAVNTVLGQVCPEGCQVKADTSLFPRELFPDTTRDYFFFATGWGNQPQFAFPMGWAPQP
jgi:hypothetical protein